MNRRIISIGLLIALTFSIGYTLGVVVVTKQLKITATLQTIHLSIYDENYNEISTLDFGVLPKGEPINKTIYLKNLTPSTLSASWNVENLPEGVSIIVYYELRSGGLQVWNMNDLGINMFNPEEERKIVIVLTYNEGTDGPIEFTLNFNTQES